MGTYLITSLGQAEEPGGFLLSFVDYRDAAAVVALVGLIIPLVTGLVTKSNASSQVKALVTTALSVLTAVIANLATADGNYDWKGFLSAFLVAFVPAIATYYGLWKPTGVAGSVQSATSGVGIGGSTPAVTHEPETHDPNAGVGEALSHLDEPDQQGEPGSR